MDGAQIVYKRILPLLIALLIIAPLSYSLYVSFFVKAKLAALDREFEELSAAVPVRTEIKYNRFEETEKYKKAVEALDSIEARVKSRLPSLDNFGGMADSIQELASECGVEVAGLNIFNPSTDSGLDIYPMKIKLDCKSTYKAFKKFLWGIEKCSETIFIEKLEISSGVADEKISYSYHLLGYISAGK